MAVRRKHIRAVAERILVSHQIHKAPVPIKEIAQAMGVQVKEAPTEDNLSGFLFRDPQHRQAIIGINKRHHPNRQRFTMAHELGHFLLHEGERIHIDSLAKGFEVNLRDDASSLGIDEDEKEANLFAAEILMPASFLEKDLARLDLLDEDANGEILEPLAKRYRVSVQALTVRLSYLGYVSI
ncbi:MAG: ImmA/IrrE family metallo-endopeptidase [Acidobacteria bacterium]|nr:ImmA/IrrE family metallo-endopeptidase [Acidobacteriota bacterium]MCI0627738.1 ImmA/IrrE family metallo-endopeptidase [Acidobacteriota bacterium]MCI0719167.1 ImmA/IrrE family metallo-endopeptidase [Acidobacteriota bacterium]